MKIPSMRGLIDRRILANWRVDPAVLARLVPPPFRPQVIDGVGIAGVCLIRLKHIRPTFLPAMFGFSSENAAPRIAVEWEVDGEVHRGVYVPRRDTSSRFNSLLGGRLFPGRQHHARFNVRESIDRVEVTFDSDDGQSHMHVTGNVASEIPPGSIFASLREASAFFESGSLSYSATGTPGRLDGIELHCSNWSVQPLAIERIQSTFIDDRRLFPAGAAEFDCALLMRGIEHEWRGRKQLCCDAVSPASCMPA